MDQHNREMLENLCGGELPEVVKEVYAAFYAGLCTLGNVRCLTPSECVTVWVIAGAPKPSVASPDSASGADDQVAPADVTVSAGDADASHASDASADGRKSTGKASGTPKKK